MMTRLGLGSYGVAWAVGVPGYEQPPHPLDAFGLLRRADELGLRLVQIADNLPLHELSPAKRNSLLAEAERLHVAVEVGTRGIQPDHLQRYLQIARDFNSPILRVVVDTATHHPVPEEVVSLLRPQLAAFAAAGTTLAIENHDRFKAKTLAAIITTLDHPNVGICLDTVNSFGAMEGPEIVVETLGRFVVNLHVKEFVIQRLPHHMGFTVTGAPAGQGMLDIAWLLSTLRGYGSEFNAILENWLAPEASVEATIQKEADYSRQSVTFLRTLIHE
jgi:3-oxoisoapionate decarboxylase